VKRTGVLSLQRVVKRTGVLSLQIITSTCKGVPSSCIGLTRKSGEEDRSPFIAENL